MPRVTASEVKEIMAKCTVDDAIVDTFIISANAVVTAILGGTDIGTDLLKEVERWFTAHMIASTLHRMTSEEKLEEATVKYTGSWGKNLESTPYGQVVLQIDTTGKMAAQGKRQVNIVVIDSFD